MAQVVLPPIPINPNAKQAVDDVLKVVEFQNKNGNLVASHSFGSDANGNTTVIIIVTTK